MIIFGPTSILSDLFIFAIFCIILRFSGKTHFPALFPALFEELQMPSPPLQVSVRPSRIASRSCYVLAQFHPGRLTSCSWDFRKHGDIAVAANALEDPIPLPDEGETWCHLRSSVRRGSSSLTCPRAETSLKWAAECDSHFLAWECLMPRHMKSILANAES